MSACLFFWIFVGSFHFNRRFTLIHSSLFNLVIQKTTTTTSLYSCSINTHTHARPSNIHQSSMMINVDDALKVRSKKKQNHFNMCIIHSFIKKEITELHYTCHRWILFFLFSFSHFFYTNIFFGIFFSSLLYHHQNLSNFFFCCLFCLIICCCCCPFRHLSVG